MWHLLFLAFFAFSIYRLIVYQRHWAEMNQRYGQRNLPRSLPMKKAQGNDLLEIAGQVFAETEKAYRFFDGKSIEWVPKSQVEWDSVEKVMTMPYWLAYDKGFI